jgi:putative transposase
LKHADFDAVRAIKCLAVLFRTLKHTPAYPRMPFTDSTTGERWTRHFVDWYNQVHRHSAIRFVTPDERNQGREAAGLARHELYDLARRSHPNRWTANTRNWNPVGLVVLNPQKEGAES